MDTTKQISANKHYTTVSILTFILAALISSLACAGNQADGQTERRKKMQNILYFLKNYKKSKKIIIIFKIIIFH